MTSMLASLDQTVIGLLRGWLDDHRTGLLLRASLFTAIVAVVALLTIDPDVPRFGGVIAMQQTPDTALRDAALKFWLDNGQLGRARLFVWVEALGWAPVFALFVASLLLHYDRSLRADGGPPSSMRWCLLIALSLSAFVINTAAAAVTLYALRAAAAGTGLSPRLHAAVHAASWLSVWAWSVARDCASFLEVVAQGEERRRWRRVAASTARTKRGRLSRTTPRRVEFASFATHKSAALRRAAGEDVVARVKWQRDPAIAQIVSRWQGRFDWAGRSALGMHGFEHRASELVATQS